MRRYLTGVVVVVTVIGSLVMSAAAGPAAAGVRSAPPKVRTIMVGSNPIAVALSSGQARGYVLNDGSVSVLNLVTHREIAEPKTGFHDQTAIALVQSGASAYIGTFDLNELKVLDTKTLKITSRVRVGKGTTAVVSASTSAGQFAYVAQFSSEGSVGQVVVVRVSNATLLTTIKLPSGAATAETAPGGKSVWVGGIQSGQLWVISTSSQKVVKTIAVTKSGPVASIAFNKNGTRAWVSGLGGVSEVNVATGKVVAFISITKIFPKVSNLTAGPIELNNSGTQALVVNSTSVDNPGKGTVAVLSTRTLKVSAQIKVGTEPIGMAIDRKRNTAYVANYLDDTVSYFQVPK